MYVNRFLIADDQPIVRVTLEWLLADAFPDAEIHLVGSWEEAKAHLERTRFCLAILELQMPARRGRLAMLGSLAKRAGAPPILVFTASASSLLAIEVIDRGAMGCMLKTSSLVYVLEAVHSVLAGGTALDPILDLNRGRTHPWYSLSDAERRVIIQLVKGRSLREVAVRTGRSYKTVTTHKYNAMRKLGVPPGSDLFPYLMAQGIYRMFA